jgi:hypothetical protein
MPMACRALIFAPLQRPKAKVPRDESEGLGEKKKKEETQKKKKERERASEPCSETTEQRGSSCDSF